MNESITLREPDAIKTLGAKKDTFDGTLATDADGSSARTGPVQFQR